MECVSNQHPSILYYHYLQRVNVTEVINMVKMDDYNDNNVDATSEEEAHKKLVKDGGVKFNYDYLHVDKEDYENAECIEEIDLDDN